jgi:hypothetical protein
MIKNIDKKIAILQPNYIPWKGYFDMINMVDEFIILDKVQYTEQDWRNRNRIKTRQGVQWMTIPVRVKDSKQKICDTCIASSYWRKKHWKTICTNYCKTPYFKDFANIFEQLYLESNETSLTMINYQFIVAICRILEINSLISWADDIQMPKTDRLIHICEKLNANEYLSGPSAKTYIDEEKLNDAGIKLTYMDYSGYPMYRQQFPPFIHEVSIIDLIFNEGPNVSKYMKSFSK